MRHTLLLGLSLALAACESFPVPTDPRVHVSPYYAHYRLRGDVAMQSNPGTGPEDNAAQSLDALGQGHHADDAGVRADIGDGFSGIRVDYYQLEMGPRGSTTLTDEFGSIPTGATAQAQPKMDEWRLSLTHEVYATKMRWRQDPIDMRFGLGGTWANRRMDVDVRGSDLLGSYAQKLDFGGDVFFGAARFRATLGQVSLDVEYALSPDLQTGEWDDVQQDFETRLSYAVPFQDVTVFAGWRYATLDGSGSAGGLGYDADMTIDGYQFGVTVTF